MKLRIAKQDDLQTVVDIYNSTISSRMVTADTEPVTAEDKLDWFLHHTESRPLYIVENEAQECIGWISFESFYGRPAYAKTAEVSIYLHKAHRGKGAGSAVLKKALNAASGLGIRSLMAFIFAHNEPSIRLFQKFGFSEWGHFPGIAEMDGHRYDLKILGKELKEGETF
ncbi:GNAT family N-acetyltransferase [Bacillus sonorensis]|nr:MULTISPECIES: GNAT family N-acetyltransferase [Bacillus]ASB87051.1 Phosphinothricin acetyltransferase [Bacillus sonorensis]MBG9914885.1 phosphinothricin acetyltransferase [Bacillus sonorensis]MCF7616301.1 N-acetyltransferase family protein [Bacillus sonorensis]MCY7857772.1 GNAT family N-acetyltransferase [Bacillus sonorensis]MCY8023683.1 GNAT family N-acetyltransferase [Bacillus sonorensis]